MVQTVLVLFLHVKAPCTKSETQSMAISTALSLDSQGMCRTTEHFNILARKSAM